jgi:hypothetical protein
MFKLARLATVAATVMAAVVALPAVAAAQMIPGNPPASIGCDNPPLGSTTIASGIYWQPNYYAPLTTGVVQRGQVRACLYLSSPAFTDADLYLERKAIGQDPDTAWDVVKTTKGGPWYRVSSTPFASFEGFDTTIPSGAYQWRWRIQWVYGAPQFKFVAMNR